jgi:hypothetical protein
VIDNHFFTPLSASHFLAKISKFNGAVDAIAFKISLDARNND